MSDINEIEESNPTGSNGPQRRVGEFTKEFLVYRRLLDDVQSFRSKIKKPTLGKMMVLNDIKSNEEAKPLFRDWRQEVLNFIDKYPGMTSIMTKSKSEAIVQTYMLYLDDKQKAKEDLKDIPELYSATEDTDFSKAMEAFRMKKPLSNQISSFLLEGAKTKAQLEAQVKRESGVETRQDATTESGSSSASAVFWSRTKGPWNSKEGGRILEYSKDLPPTASNILEYLPADFPIKKVLDLIEDVNRELTIFLEYIIPKWYTSTIQEEWKAIRSNTSLNQASPAIAAMPPMYTAGRMWAKVNLDWKRQRTAELVALTADFNNLAQADDSLAGLNMFISKWKNIVEILRADHGQVQSPAYQYALLEKKLAPLQLAMKLQYDAARSATGEEIDTAEDLEKFFIYLSKSTQQVTNNPEIQRNTPSTFGAWRTGGASATIQKAREERTESQRDKSTKGGKDSKGGRGGNSAQSGGSNARDKTRPTPKIPSIPGFKQLSKEAAAKAVESKICLFFATSGKCRFGDKCTFKHEKIAGYPSKTEVKTEVTTEVTTVKSTPRANSITKVESNKVKTKEANRFAELAAEDDESSDDYPGVHAIRSPNIIDPVTRTVLDPGAQAHVLSEAMGNSSLFTEDRNLPPTHIKVVGGTVLTSMKRGTLKIGNVNIVDCGVFAGERSNLISTWKLKNQDPENQLLLRDEGRTLLIKTPAGNVEGRIDKLAPDTAEGLYIVEVKMPTDITASAVVNTARASKNRPARRVNHGHLLVPVIVHNALAHVSDEWIKRASTHPDMDRQWNYKETGFNSCINCMHAVAIRQPKGKTSVNASIKYGEIYHADLHIIQSDEIDFIGTLIVVEKSTRYTIIRLLKRKDEATPIITKFLELELKFMIPDQKIHQLIADKGGEFDNDTLSAWCQDHQISLELVPREHHELNGIAERRIRTIPSIARTLALTANLPPKYYWYALRHANDLLNFLPCKSTGRIPFTAKFGKKVATRWFQPWGCLAYVANDNNTHHKSRWDRSDEGVFLGVSITIGRPYLILKLDSRRIVESLEVQFVPDQFPFRDRGDQTIGRPIPQKSLPWDDNQINTEEVPNEPADKPGENIEEVPNEPADKPGKDIEENDTEINNPYTDNSLNTCPNTDCELPHSRTCMISIAKKKVPLPVRAEHYVNGVVTAKEAALHPEFIDARAREMQGLWDNGTFGSPVKLPPGARALRTKWTYAVKELVDKGIKYKARLVILGFLQRLGYDYEETFAPVISINALRFVFAIKVQWNLTLHALDVSQAFTNAKLDKEIYITPPDGYKEDDKVWPVHKALYGLKQSGRLWNELLTEVLKQAGYTQCEVEKCLFWKRTNNGITIIPIWVDDMHMVSNDEVEVSRIILILNKNFPTNLVKNPKILGMDIVDKPGRFELSQEVAVRKYLGSTTAEHLHYKVSDTPMAAPLTHWEKPTEICSAEQLAAYQSDIGSLLFFAGMTRPDIAYAVNYAARGMANPGEQHFLLVRRIQRYLRGTLHYCLVYRKIEKPEISALYGYADASYGDVDGHSTGGHILFFGKNSPIVWKSGKQKTAAMSTTEAELFAFTAAGKHMQWLSAIYNALNETKQPAPTIYCDNISSVAILSDITSASRVKHVLTKIAYITGLIASKELKAVYVKTAENLADLFTKPLPAATHNLLLAGIMN